MVGESSRERDEVEFQANSKCGPCSPGAEAGPPSRLTVPGPLAHSGLNKPSKLKTGKS